MRLKVLLLVKVGLETPCAVAFWGLGSLQILVLDRETGLQPGDSLQEQSPQVAQYTCILSVSLACWCTNAWGPGLSGLSKHTCTWYHTSEKLGTTPRILFSPFSGVTTPRLWTWNSFGQVCLLLLLISLPFLQETRNSISRPRSGSEKLEGSG